MNLAVHCVQCNMPAHYLPVLTNVHHDASSGGVDHVIRRNKLQLECSAVHFYENELTTTAGSSGYVHGRGRRQSTRSVEKGLVSQTNAVHLPAVQTGSASSSQARIGASSGGGVGALVAVNTRSNKPGSTSANTVKPLSPDAVLERFAAQMTSYEQREIYNYPQVYFIGLNAAKRSGVAGAANNDGYDDDHAAYIQVCISCLSISNHVNVINTILEFVVSCCMHDLGMVNFYSQHILC